MLKEIVVAFGGLIGNLVSGKSIGAEFAGPVGIATITGQAARLGFVYLLQFTALLSLNLAVINILPFPALDGGRILFLLIEKAKGKPVRRDVEAILHNIGFLLLIALVIFVTYKDIVKLF
jgi:regulator of sigma E protease